LLYSNLLQPQDKLELLHSKSFVAIIVLIVFTFSLEGYGDQIGVTDMDFLENSLYSVIGMLMIQKSVSAYRIHTDELAVLTADWDRGNSQQKLMIGQEGNGIITAHCDDSANEEI
jgi:hypothetical protein